LEGQAVVAANCAPGDAVSRLLLSPETAAGDGRRLSFVV
jgi:hypothetical protein